MIILGGFKIVLSYAFVLMHPRLFFAIYFETTFTIDESLFSIHRFFGEFFEIFRNIRIFGKSITMTNYGVIPYMGICGIKVDILVF